MPEQPEVERAARRLSAAVEGRRIVHVAVLHPAQRRGLPDDQARLLIGRLIVAVERRGKHQFIRLDEGGALHVHFRMAGDWWIGPSAADAPPHERVRVELDDGTAFSLVDPRALATAVVLAAGAALPAIGPEVADPIVTASWLRSALVGRRGAIKPTLLDQKLLAGVGNIYASEALWHARLHPETQASALGPVRLERLIIALRTALQLGETAATRYRGDAGAPRLSVYDRAGEPCFRCQTPIRRLTQAGRSTYFCPGCQRR